MGGPMRTSQTRSPLLAAGITSFHVGRKARVGESWDGPVSAEAVARWRRTVDLDSHGRS